MKRESTEPPLAGMNRTGGGAKNIADRAMLPMNPAVMSRCRNLPGVDAMILPHRNFGKGWAQPGARINSTCGCPGVTSGPRSPKNMLTSLRIPNSPTR